MIEQRANHPSIVLWVLFNEGWGQFETERLVRRVKAADSSRLVDNASGWTDLKLGDVMDLHSYPGPLASGSENARARVLGEFGGLGLGVRDHTWSRQPPWGYQIMTNAQQLMRQYGLLVDRVQGLQRTNGLAGAVYTQLTDVETECNGFLTYDRDVMKMDPAEVRRVNQRLLPATREQMLLPNAVQGNYVWSYITNKPAADWMQPSFDASGWSSGPGGFGTPNTPGAIVNTIWNTADIWLRREFNLDPSFAPPLALVMNHDEDAEVYLNGVPAANAASYSNHYQEYPIYAAALQALHPGINVIAIHCHQTIGGQFIDAGLLAQPGAP
jgi:hypothetical protein